MKHQQGNQSVNSQLVKNFFGAFHHEYRNEEIELYIEGGAVSANKEYSSVVSEGIQSRFVRIIAEKCKYLGA